MDTPARAATAGAARLLGLALLVLAGSTCGGEREAALPLHDTGHEILGDPSAVVATVDGQPVTLAEANLLATFWLDATAPEARRTQSRADLQHRAIERLIEQLVLVAEAERRGFSVSDSAIDERIAQWEAQARDLAEVEARLERSHVTMATVREHLRRDAVIQEMVTALIDDTLQVRDDEVQRYYDEHPEFFDNKAVRARHILIAAPSDAPAESLAAARARAEALLARVRAGEDFAELARAHSSCPSAPQGGDLGFGRRNQWVKPFEEAAFALQPGEVSEVVPTSYGFHIIQVIEVDDNHPTPISEVGAAIRQFLRSQNTQVAVDQLAAGLRAQARIERTIPPRDAPAADPALRGR